MQPARDLLVARLAVQRGLVDSARLERVVAQVPPGGVSAALVQHGLVPAADANALAAYVERSRFACRGCRQTWGSDQLQPGPRLRLTCPGCGSADLAPAASDAAGRPQTWRDSRSRAGGQTWADSTGGARAAAGGPLGATGEPLPVPPRDGRATAHDPVSGSAIEPNWQPTASMRIRGTFKPGGRVGDYDVLEELGRGGMGVVFKARHTGTGRDVALKVLLAGAGASERQVKRFHREAQALARLEHPHIIKVFDQGQEGEHLYFTMELVDGRDLGELIAEGVVSRRRAVELTQQVAEALQYAHERGIVHRDVKPDNVLIEADGTPRLTDFGLVRDRSLEQSRLTRSGALVGTPYYMSPEQASGKAHRLTGAADVYSLGVVLFEMLTGTLPFSGETHIELTQKVMETPAPRPSSVVPDLPRDLDAVVLRCLAKDPDDRYATAGDLADDLGRYLAGQPVLASPPAQRPPWLVPVVGGLIACLAVVFGVVAVLVATRSSGPPPEAVTATPPPATTPTPDPPPTEDLARVAAGRARELLEASRRIGSGEPYRRAVWRAIEAFDEACLLAPEDPDLRLERGLAYASLLEEERATEDLREVQRLAGAERTELGARATYSLASLARRGDRAEAIAADLATRWLDRWGTEPNDPVARPYEALLRVTRRLADIAETSLPGLIKRVVEVREAHPDCAEAWASEASLRLNAMQTDEGEAALAHALQLRPNDALLWTVRAQLALLVHQDPTQARQDLEHALDLCPTLPTALEMRGVLRAKQGDTAGAIIDLQRVLERRPASGNALDNLVRLLAGEDRLAEARSLLEKAERAAPTRAEPYLAAYRFAVDRAEFAEAAAAVRRGLVGVTDDAGRADLEERLETVYREARLTDEAIAYADQVLRSQPHDPSALCIKGEALAFTGRADQALTLWEAELGVNPTNARVAIRRLRLLAGRLGNGALADEVKTMLEACPDDVEALEYGVRAWGQLGDPERAQALAERAREVAPTSFRSWRALALAALVRQDARAVLEAARRGAALEPDDPEINRLIGQALLNQGDQRGAWDAFLRALGLWPLDGDSARLTARLAIRLGNPQKALELIDQHERALKKCGRSVSPGVALEGLRALVAVGQPQAALSLARQLAAAQVPDPDFNVDLAQALVELGQPDLARTLLRAMARAFPSHHEVRQLLAELGG